MEHRKIGWNDWIHIRKWQLVAVMAIMGWGGTSIGVLTSQESNKVINGVVWAVATLCIMVMASIKMAKDKELNQRNGKKHFWWSL